MKKYFILFFISIVILSSCNQKDYKGMPPSTGGASELLIIMQNSKWNSNIGDSLRSIFSSHQEGLPQAEPLFDIIQISKNDFKGLFEKNRKILKIIIADTIKKETIFARKNIYSAPQIIIEVAAKSDSAAFTIIKSRFESIVTMLKETEYARINEAFATTMNLSLKTEMEKNFGFYCVMPESFYKAKQTQIFAWYRLEHSKYSQAMMIYVNDFIDSSQFEVNNIIASRNNITKANIPGSIQGSYMSTDTTSFNPITTAVPFGNTYAVETRGLWKVEGDFMGGPFLSYTFKDKSSKKIITLDSYVYYPNKDKRDLLLQLEAIMHSFAYSEKNEK